MNPFRTVLTAAIGAALLAAAPAQDPKPAPTPAPAEKQDQRIELRDRMAARYPLVAALRDAGKVGETPTGELKLVKADYGTEKVDPKDANKGTVAELVAAENKDRLASYELIAKDLAAKGTKVTAAEVGKEKGVRNFANAKPDHWIEVDGKWVQRKTVKAETREKPPAKS